MNSKLRKTIKILLWITQAMIALTLMWSGYMKVIQPEQLPFPWIHVNPRLALLTSVVDFIGGIGIIVPSLTGIKPKLTTYAAYGIVTLMAAAVIFHISRGEAKDIGFNIFMALLAVFVAWGRTRFDN